MTSTHSPVLVALSTLIAALASLVAFDFAGQAARLRGSERWGWLLGGAAAAGLGVWSMHFVGMLAFHLNVGRAPVPISFEMVPMLAALLVAITGALTSLGFLAWARGAAAPVVIGAGLAAAAGILGNHYIAIASMRLPADIAFRTPRVAASAAIAFGAATAAAWLARQGAREDAPPWRWHLAAPAALTGAMLGTHYVAMFAAQFRPRAVAAEVNSRSVLATDGLAAVVVVSTLLVLFLAALAAALHRESEARRQAADDYAGLYRAAEGARAEAEAAQHAAEESEHRFRETADAAPALMWVADANGKWTYVNTAWREYTGVVPPLGMDDGLAATVHGDDLARRRREYLGAFANRQRYAVEYRLRGADGQYRWVLESAAPRFTGAGAFVGFVGLCVDITERKETEQRQALMLDAARRLGSTLDVGATLQQITRVLVPAFADICVVRVLDDEGSELRQVAAAHVDPGKEPLLDELGRRYQPAADDSRSVVARVLGGTASVLRPEPSYEDVAGTVDDPAVRRIVGELGAVSSIVVPLVASSRAFGTLTLATSTSGRVYAQRDLEHGEMLGARAALALENARLYAAAQRAREEAVLAAELKAELAQARLDALRTQLNPHFLFNALNTVAMLVRRGANDDALRGVLSLSGLLRRVLDGSAQAESPVREELALVEHYLQLERLRFRDRLDVRVDVTSEALDALVPGLLLQPLVENAVRHGVAHAASAGEIIIRGERDDGTLVLEVCDNGPGFPEGWERDPPRGLGLTNTRERLAHMYGGNFALDTGNRPDGGATVAVALPYHTVRDAESFSG